MTVLATEPVRVARDGRTVTVDDDSIALGDGALEVTLC